jgi:hypothetical protein
MNKSKLATIITISLILPSCVKRIPDENKFHKYTDGMNIPNDLYQTKLLVHFIDSIPPDALIGSSSWDNNGMISPDNILSPYIPEKNYRKINKNEKKLTESFNSIVSLFNAQLLNEITQCKVKCVPFRKADYLKLANSQYPASRYTYVLVRSISTYSGIRFHYHLFDRINKDMHSISLNFSNGTLSSAVHNEQMIFRKLSYEYLKRYPE